MNSYEKSVLYWFRERRNAMIVNHLIDHSVKVYDTCLAATECIDILKNKGSMEPIVKRISAHEKAADHLQDRVSVDISRGFIPVTIKQNLFRMIRTNDKVSNWTKTGTMDLYLLQRLDLVKSVPEEIFTLYEELLEENRIASKLVWDMVKKLSVDDEFIIEGLKKSLEHEKKADVIYGKLKEQILSVGKTMPYSFIFLLLDAAKSFEQASDSVKDTAVFLHLILIQGRTEIEEEKKQRH